MTDKRATVDLLGELHGEVAKGLLARIRSGEATAADFTAALKLLKDNNIEALPVAGSPLAALAASLGGTVLPFARPAGLPPEEADEAAA